MADREIRTLSRPIELRAEGEAGAMTITGYAAVFNSRTSIGDCWDEVISPGAFRETLASGQDVLALYSHELERLLGRRSSGTLRLVEDDKGLKVEIDLPDTTDGRDVWTLVKRGDLKGMSFGFCVTRQEWDETTDPALRTIMAVDLREVTVTADPAYQDTELGQRALTEHRRATRARNYGAASARIAERKMRTEQAARRIN